MEAIRARLSYSLPAFRPDGYVHAEAWLRKLQDLGFRRVTFHPTYAVYDAEEPLIDKASSPYLIEAFTIARELGFHITLEPHLDWATTLHDGPYEWRRRMRIRPANQYLDDVLAPLAGLLPDALTLGSELDASTIEFTEEWASLVDRFAGLSLGHKLNHDIFESGRRRAVQDYVQQLGYIAFSFYPPDGAFEKQARKLNGKVGKFVIGEFGLGSKDVSRPWHFDATTFESASDLAIRTRYYLEFLKWLGEQPYASSATFWTAGHFDVLGVMHPQWEDAAIVEAVRLVQ